jgi:hypothetical protein
MSFHTYFLPPQSSLGRWSSHDTLLEALREVRAQEVQGRRLAVDTDTQDEQDLLDRWERWAALRAQEMPEPPPGVERLAWLWGCFRKEWEQGLTKDLSALTDLYGA